jgi:DNA-binding transcriptional ArsR family regulator
MSGEGATLLLGRDGDDRPVELPVEALLRHVMALGASGSGKTVFCKVVVEEAVRHGLPAICIDPQGDISSLAAGTLDDDELTARGVDPGIARAFRAAAEVVIFTPGSARGVPLCADPVDASLGDLGGSERAQAIGRTSAVVVALLGFDLSSDDGAGLVAVVDRTLAELLEAGERPSLARLTEHLMAAEADGFASYSRYLDPKKLRTACQRLARLDVGARRVLFHDGVPIDVDVLLGRDPRAPVEPGRARVAVIYLNTLHNQDDKDFFVAALVDRLYAWMLAHPSASPQALFYIDEVAPFIPPVRKPACKDGLSLLFKQARKYGVCCLMATQNPGDVDYRAMAQFGTWALGRLTTRQDLKKVEPIVKSLAPDASDAILGALPSLKPGQMRLISPDRFDAPVELSTRWLVTRHETWSEERIEERADEVRGRFAGLAAPASDLPLPRSGGAPAPASDLPLPRSGGGPGRGSAPASAPDLPLPRSGGGPGRGSAPASASDLPLPRSGGGPGRGSAPASAPASASPCDEPSPLLQALARLESASAKELAAAIGKSESAVRRGLDRLVDANLAGVFQRGRSKRYWAIASEARPDLGMPARIDVIVAHVTAETAAAIGGHLARAKVLGLIGDDERFERAEPLHRLVYKLDFEEKVERGLLGRLFGDAHDERLGSVYVHPHNLGVLVFGNEEGIRFTDRPTGPASDVSDFDGVTETEARAPGSLAFEELDWTARKSPDAIKRSFVARFDASPGEVTPLFVPLWNLLFRTEKDALRRITIDAIVGKPVRWLPP